MEFPPHVSRPSSSRLVQTLYNTHVKLLAFDFLSLTRNQNTGFVRKGISLSRAETLGVVTIRDLNPGKFLRFSIDDGTGCIPCILWLNQLTSRYIRRRHPEDVEMIASVAANFESMIQLGNVARVRGKITQYKGIVQLTVCSVVIERDPNIEILHRLECIHLARKCYDVASRTGDLPHPVLNFSS